MLTPAVSKLGRKYGLRPSRDSQRTWPKAWPMAYGSWGSTPSVDHRPLLRPVRDQGQEGSCFAHAVAALKEFNCAQYPDGKTRASTPVPLGGYLSVAYLSWRTRLAEGTFPQDSGASIADAMEILRAWGACPEAFLPYNQNPSQAGNAQCDVAAVPYRVHQPCTVPVDGASWRTVLEAGHCIAIGFSVYASFEDTGPDGVVPPVQPGEGLLGGHAVLVCGYGPKGFIVRNSWGAGFGDLGYVYFPDSYLANVWEAWTTT